ncbi:hypothetical protein M2336_001048 [Sphingobium sp. B1D7B]|uniref:hypothetical protein n=1 Tax=Sphingobium sp. B1D7B TaxID=2940578 RepID=UPI002224EC67|nr:hypothetical protein [Sphingobium sp. B1D7B]MCW2404419.1 hypothetical protein [Sphingobium sp. B1D7B]
MTWMVEIVPGPWLEAYADAVGHPAKATSIIAGDIFMSPHPNPLKSNLTKIHHTRNHTISIAICDKRGRSMKHIPFIILATFLLPLPLQAHDWSLEAKVTRVEPSYMPYKVYLQIDTDAGQCTAGSWIQWIARGDDQATKAANTQAVLAVAMTALVAGKRLTLVGNNGDCSLNFVHLIP